MGSPPRVREKLAFHEDEYFDDGITPACAGKTTSKLLTKDLAWDHPRVCGKNVTEEVGEIRDVGSPPRVREKHVSIPSS